MAAPSMVTRDGDNLVIRSVVSGDALFGTEEIHEESVLGEPVEEEPTPEEFLPQTRVKRNYSCSSCDFATQNPRVFLYHLRDDHDQKFKIYECPRCLYASRHSQKLHRHMHMVHVLGAGKRKPTSRALRRLKPKPDSKAPPPPPADTEFTLSDDGTSILYKCSVCPFKSKSQNALVKHERVVHLKKKFFRCSKCDYATHIRARYTKHVKYHSMPMIKCDICDFRTPYKWNLERHNKNHQGGGAFQCFMCNFTADIKQSLTVHELNHHTDGAARRRYKVGSSDSAPTDDNLDILHFESKEANVLSKAERIAARKNNLKLRKLHKLQETLLRGGEGGQVRIKCRSCIFSHESLDAVRAHETAVHGAAPELPLLDQIKQEPLSKPAVDVHQEKSKKTPRPPPGLIPIGPPPAKKPTPALNPVGASSLADLSSRNSSLKDFASLIGDDNAFVGDEPTSNPIHKSVKPALTDTRSSTPDSLDSTKREAKKKTSSFFDKLQEKLMTGTTSADLLCSLCGHQAKCLSELVKHRETLHPEEEAAEANTCNLCGLVCNSAAEHKEHVSTCRSTPEPKTTPDLGLTGTKNTPEKHPMENRVFVWNTFQPPSALDQPLDEHPLDYPEMHDKVEDQNIYLGTEIKPGYGTACIIDPATDPSIKKSTHLRKAYKCPHCDFWASTASRFHVHFVGHLNKRPFRCSLCQYSSNWRWDITKHIRLKTFRDPEHTGARVLLTDEAGMRDYAKYLALIKVENNTTVAQAGAQNNSTKPVRPILPRLDNSAKRRSGDSQEQSVPKKQRLFNTKKLWKCKKCQYRNSDRQVVLAHVRAHYYPEDGKSETGQCDVQPAEGLPESGGGVQDTAQPVVSTTESTDHASLSPLKQALASSFQDNNPVGSDASSTHQSDAEAEDAEPCSDYMCETCPYECETLAALEQHAEKHFVTHGTANKCKECPYYADSSEDLEKHSKLHEEPDEPMEMKSVIFACLKCPYFAKKRTQLTYHKKWHSGKRKDGLHTCPKLKCSYAAPTNTILALHVRLHRHTSQHQGDGESKYAQPRPLVPPKPSPSMPVSSYADITSTDTSHFPEIPLVWVCKGSRISKMFKCRHCPHVNIRKPVILDHERMHSERSPAKLAVSSHRCNLCSYICTNAGNLASHVKVHQAFYGTVCAIADSSRSDEEQIEEVKQRMIQDEISDLKGDAVVGQVGEAVPAGVERLIHFCATCPARFLYHKELLIHSRFHVLKLPFKCDTCTYTARQRQHLFIHKKVHTNDYHERTKTLLLSYSESLDDPRPKLTLKVDSSGPQWVVTSEMDPSETFECPKCPAKFSDKESYERHFVFHGWSGKFKCKFCDYTVLQYDSLLQHEMLHVDEDDISGLTQLQHSKIMRSPEQTKKQYIDPEFGTDIQGSPDFVYPTSMRNGKKKEKRYKCHKCPTAFEKRDQYKIHMALHGAKQRYSCEKCDYSVKYYANFIQHMKKHSLSEEAGGKSGSEGSLPEDIPSNDDHSHNNSQDIRVIEEVARKSMGMCLADEQALELLRQREADTRFSTDPVHRCPYCPYTAPRRDAVTSHMKCHSPPSSRANPYSCLYCDYKVPHLRFLTDHMKSHFTPMKYLKPESYMKVDKLEIWAEDAASNDSKFLVFKDSGENMLPPDNRFLPPWEGEPKPSPPSEMRGRIYIDLKTGEEEVEIDDEIKQEPPDYDEEVEPPHPPEEEQVQENGHVEEAHPDTEQTTSGLNVYSEDSSTSTRSSSAHSYGSSSLTNPSQD